ncbi:Ig-like domain-containing protein, partial [bacterium]|nr:Ig-like domain-containing protein [bacterium]
LAAWAGNGPLYSANVMVSGVIIAPLNSTVYQENTVQLSAEVLPWDASNKTVNWSSNNTDVATVNASGLVSAVTAGVATITGTSVDGAKQA